MSILDFKKRVIKKREFCHILHFTEIKSYKFIKNYEYYYFIIEKRLFSFSTCWISIFGGLKKRGVKRASFSTVFTPHLKWCDFQYIIKTLLALTMRWRCESGAFRTIFTPCMKSFLKNPKKSQKIRLFQKNAYALSRFFEHDCVIIIHKVFIFNIEK